MPILAFKVLRVSLVVVRVENTEIRRYCIPRSVNTIIPGATYVRLTENDPRQVVHFQNDNLLCWPSLICFLQFICI